MNHTPIGQFNEIATVYSGRTSTDSRGRVVREYKNTGTKMRLRVVDSETREEIVDDGTKDITRFLLATPSVNRGRFSKRDRLKLSKEGVTVEIESVRDSGRRRSEIELVCWGVVDVV